MDYLKPLPSSLLPFITFFLKKHWKRLALVQLFSFGWTIDHTLWPYVIMVLIDTMTKYSGDQAGVWSALSVPIGMGLILYLVVEFSFRMAGILSVGLFPKVEADIRTSMYRYVLGHSSHYFATHLPGTIANKISDMPQHLTRLLEKIIFLFFPVVLALIISCGLFLLINPVFAWILGVWICLHGLIGWLCSKNCAITSAIHAEARSLLSGKIVDGLTNNANIRLFARQNFEFQYLSGFQGDELRKHTNALWAIEKMKLIMGIVGFFGTFLGLNWYMIYSWQQGTLSTGEVVFIFNTTWNITMMAWLAALELPVLFKEAGVCRQALSIIQHPHDVVDQPGAQSLALTAGEIIFDQVSFAYKQSQQLFLNKNIVIHAGEKVGLVGFSGSGKTTFINLILRNYDIQGGQILIDGQNIAKVTQNSLRESITIIPQDPILLHRTVIENIRYSRLSATDEEVIAAAKQARCHDFILKLPEQYNAMVGDRGTKLSGGQRQRIAIARAILRKVPHQIFILDEATSALDSILEREIQEVLEELFESHTTLVIAHRLSTVASMDRILVFKDGRIIEEGSHRTLLELDGHYAAMWRIQVEHSLPEEEEES